MGVVGMGVPSGRVVLRVPLALRVVVKSLVWRWWWSVGQTPAVLLGSVVPPFAQVLRWWVWVRFAGVVQPGQMQCRSRWARTRRRIGGANRRGRAGGGGGGVGVDKGGVWAAPGGGHTAGWGGSSAALGWGVGAGARAWVVGGGVGGLGVVVEVEGRETGWLWWRRGI